MQSTSLPGVMPQISGDKPFDPDTLASLQRRLYEASKKATASYMKLRQQGIDAIHPQAYWRVSLPELFAVGE